MNTPMGLIAFCWPLQIFLSSMSELMPECVMDITVKKFVALLVCFCHMLLALCVCVFRVNVCVCLCTVILDVLRLMCVCTCAFACMRSMSVDVLGLTCVCVYMHVCVFAFHVCGCVRVNVVCVRACVHVFVPCLWMH